MIEAHFIDGSWYLCRDGVLVTVSPGIPATFANAPHCTRYAKEHFGAGIDAWIKPGTVSLSASEPPPGSAQLSLL